MAKSKKSDRIGKPGEAEAFDKGFNRSGFDVARENLAKLAQMQVEKQMAARKMQIDPAQRSIDAAFGASAGVGPSMSGVEAAPSGAGSFQNLKKIVAAPAAPTSVSQDLAQSLAHANMSPEQLQDEEDAKKLAALKAAAMRAQQGQ